ERGMEKEGFSSLDGRTSIYDYCIVPSIKRWIQKKLNTDEIAIYKEYCNLLKIATVDDIFTLGKTFDLGYVNPASEYFNPDKQFAFLRAYNQHAALIVVNFDNKEVNVRVNIPEHAFEYLNIKQTKDINSSNSVPLKIAQYNGVVNYI
ncbi:MAG: alpha amylase C-terminal domain-containing protein, partial [Bacteroidales bacterium]